MRFAMERMQETFLPPAAGDALTRPVEKHWDRTSPGFGPKLSPQQPGLILPLPSNERGGVLDDAIYPLLNPRRGQGALEEWQFQRLYADPEFAYPGA
jgi:hypothetical protein